MDNRSPEPQEMETERYATFYYRKFSMTGAWVQRQVSYNNSNRSVMQKHEDHYYLKKVLEIAIRRKFS